MPRKNWNVLLVISLTLSVTQIASAQIVFDLGVDRVDGRYWGPAEASRAGGALAGDVDGDGSQDLVVGGGGAVLDPPELFILLGPLTFPVERDLATSPAETYMVDAFPTNVRDFDGDGLAEIVVVDYLDARGRVSIFAGRRAWPPVLDLATADWSFVGADPGDGLYSSDFSINDDELNGDGIPDLVLKAHSADGPSNGRPDAGELYVFFGPPSRWPSRVDLAIDRPDVRIIGKDELDNICTVFPLVADIIGDPIGDLIFSAAGDGPSETRLGAGEVYVLHGRRTWPPTIDLRFDAPDLLVYGRGIDGGAQGEKLSTALVVDWDRDGERDLALGTSGQYNSLKGAIHVLRGRDGLSGVWDLQDRPADCLIVGPRPRSVLGARLQAVDLDGDGFDEIVASGFADSTPWNRVNAGAVWVLSSNWACSGVRDLAFEPPEVALYGARSSDQLSLGELRFASDIDGDGRRDIVVGAGGGDGRLGDRSNSGEIHVLLASTIVPQACVAQADSGPPLTVCGIVDVTLDATATLVTSCPTPPEYRWREGARIVRDWSADPVAIDRPPATATYTVEVRCGSFGNSCYDAASVVIAVDPDQRPPDLANTLRAIRVGPDVRQTWGSAPEARTYTLYRGTDKGVWPAPPPSLTGLPSPGISLPDVAFPPTRYFYRAVGVSCSGSEGP